MDYSFSQSNLVRTSNRVINLTLIETAYFDDEQDLHIVTANNHLCLKGKSLEAKAFWSAICDNAQNIERETQNVISSGYVLDGDDEDIPF